MLGMDRSSVPQVDLDELDHARVDRFLAEHAARLVESAGRDEAAIRSGILAKSSPRLLPTHAGLYVFGQGPQAYFPEWGVSCIALDGRTLLDPELRRADLEGPLPSLVAEALAFVLPSETEGAPTETSPYARTLVREVLVNALVHRDLRRASRVALRVFSDRLEIQSPGGPPEGLGDLEDVAREGGTSLARNPTIAALARKLGLADQLGRGLMRVVHEGGQGPEERVEIRTSPREVTVTLPARWRAPRDPASLS